MTNVVKSFVGWLFLPGLALMMAGCSTTPSTVPQACAENETPELRIQACTEFLAQNPPNAFAYLQRGLAYTNAGQFGRAISDHSKAIELSPGLADAFNGRGIAHSEAGKRDRALEDFATAISLDPKAQFYFNRATVLLAVQRAGAAIADMNEAISLRPEVGPFYSYRAYAWCVSGHEGNSIRDWMASLELDGLRPSDIRVIFGQTGMTEKPPNVSLADHFRQALKKWTSRGCPGAKQIFA